MNDKTEMAILRIQQAYEIAAGFGKSLTVGHSGGKDSAVLTDLAIKSGVTFRAEHNHTTADAPQTVYHIREVFNKLEQRGIPSQVNLPKESMWQLIPRKGMPPTRLVRYCCEILKERRIDNQHLLFGIRWAESTQRKTRGLHEKITRNKKDKIVFMDENDDRRKLTEICQLKSRIATNPIIDWSDAEVWEYIRKNKLLMNPLYEMGMSRVGCIGCPMASEKKRRFDFALFPKYKAAYLRAFTRMIERHHEAGRKCSWSNSDEVFKWWTDMNYNRDQIEIGS